VRGAGSRFHSEHGTGLIELLIVMPIGLAVAVAVMGLANVATKTQPREERFVREGRDSQVVLERWTRQLREAIDVAPIVVPNANGQTSAIRATIPYRSDSTQTIRVEYRCGTPSGLPALYTTICWRRVETAPGSNAYTADCPGLTAASVSCHYTIPPLQKGWAQTNPSLRPTLIATPNVFTLTQDGAAVTDTTTQKADTVGIDMRMRFPDFYANGRTGLIHRSHIQNGTTLRNSTPPPVPDEECEECE
jgi:hypothetical protein